MGWPWGCWRWPAASLALRLTPTAATDTLVGRGSASFAATERLHQRFGDEAVYVLVREPVTQLALTSDILRVQGLEGCISGNAPAGQVPPGGKDGPCARLARSKPAKVVFGPGTFLNEAIGQIQDQFSAESKARDAQAKRAATAARALARAQHKTPAQVRRYGEQAKQLVLAEFAKNVIALALKYGIRSAPQLNDPSFVSKIVFDDTKGPGVPKGALRLHLPQQEQRPDPGPLPLRPAARASATGRSTSCARRSPCPTGSCPTARAPTSSPARRWWSAT